MEANTTQTAYCYLSEQDRKYFSGYLNLALNNVDNLTDELKKRFSLFKGVSRHKIFEKAFNDQTTLSDYEQWITRFSEYLPVVRILDNPNDPISKRVVTVRKGMISLIDALNQLRHYYTHKGHAKVDISNDVYDILDHILLTTAKQVKRRYLKQDKTKEMLRAGFEEEISKLISEQKKLETRKNEERKNKGERTYRIKDEELFNAVLNGCLHDFIVPGDKDRSDNDLSDDDPSRKVDTLCAISKAKTSQKNKKDLNRWYPNVNLDFEHDILFSQRGFIFLLCLFLNKRDGELLRAGIKGFKAKVLRGSSISLMDNNLKYMITHRIYAYNAYRGTKHQLHTDEYSRELLAIQILDELSKVPDEVYKFMDDETRKKFDRDMNADDRDQAESFHEFMVNPVIRKRYEDKFVYYTVRFLDECLGGQRKGFESLRFQIHIGDYVGNIKEKELVGSKVHREIKEKITIFAHLRDVVQAKNQYFDSISDTTPGIQLDEDALVGSEEWQLFPNPRYNFPLMIDREGKAVPAGKIAFHLDLGEETNTKLASCRPLASTQKNEKIKQLLGRNFDYKSGQATAYMSTQDLHAIVYSIVNEKKTPKEIESEIRRKLQKRIGEIYKTIGEKENVTEQIDYEKLRTDINLKIKDINRRIKELKAQRQAHKRKEDERFRRGAKHERQLYTSQERGRVASWLANELKCFMDPADRKNWRSIHQRELQQALAHYHIMPKRVKEIYDIRGGRSSSFSLKLCWKASTLDGFYDTYLTEKKAFLSTLLNEFSETDAFTDKCFRFLARKNYRINSVEERARGILAHPIALESGILAEKESMKEEEWYKDYKKQPFQSFYDNELVMPQLKELEKPQGPRQGVQKSQRRTAQGKINKQKRQDITLLLIARYILKEYLGDTIEKKSLVDFYSSDKNKSNIWSEQVDLRLLDGRIQVPCKLKDVGRYIWYTRDQRVQAILSYNKHKDWRIHLPNDGSLNRVESLQHQLEQYAQDLPKILGEIHEIESYVLNACDQGLINRADLQTDGNENFRLYIVNGLLRDIKGIDVSNSVMIKCKNYNCSVEKVRPEGELLMLAYTMITIRNKFCHGQLPLKDVYDYCQEIIPHDPRQSFYSTYFYEVFKEIRTKLMAASTQSIEEQPKNKDNELAITK